MNYTTISFPSLGLELNPGRSLELGPLTFHYYGIIIAIGLILAVVYGTRRCKQFGISQDDLLDGVLCIVPFAIICARLYYCIFSWEAYADNPIEILYIWNGGLAIYGGVIGAALGVIVFCKIKKVSLGAVLDVVSLGFLIGQSIGRWGNFFNREAFGAPTESFLRMGLFDTYSQAFTYYHPTFLYESVWNLVGFIALHFFSRRRKYDGQIALCYTAWYGLGRALIEGLRMDSLYLGPVRISQLLAAISFVAAAAVLIWQLRRPHDPQNLFVNRVAAMQAAQAEQAVEAEAVETEAIDAVPDAEAQVSQPPQESEEI